MRKSFLFLLGSAAVGVACSSSDEGVVPGGDAGADARLSNSGGSAGAAHSSGGRSGGGGGTATGGSAGTGAAGGSGRGGSGGSDASSGTGGSQNSGGASGHDAGSSSGGAGGSGAAANTGGAGGFDASSTPDAATGNLAALCAAVIAADCATGPPTLGDCMSLFESIKSCSIARACIACAGLSPSVGCFNGGPDVVGCRSSCNIDACRDGGVGNGSHDSGPGAG